MLKLAQDLADPVAEAYAHTLLASMMAEAGETLEADRTYREAEEQFGPTNVDYLAWTFALHADLARLRGDFGTADALLDKADLATAPSSSPRLLAQVHFFRGLVAFDRQASSQAESELGKAASAFAQTKNRNQAPEVAGMRAQLALARGDAAAARATLASTTATSPAERTAFTATEAGILHDLGDAGAATAALAEAQAFLPHATEKLLRLQAQARLAAGHWALGEPEAARTIWREVRDEADRRKLDLLRIEATIGLACNRADALRPAVAEASERGFLRAVAWARSHCAEI